MDWRSETTSVEVQGREHIYTIGIKARVFRKDGSLRAIPPGFSASGEPQLPHGREGLLNTRITDRLNPGHNPQIHIGRGQSHIRMSALGTNNVPGAPSYDGVGNVIGRRFNGAWTGADLEWVDGGHYVKKHIYLHAGHPRVFEIRVDDRAGNLVASPRGWDLLDDNGNPVLFATPGYLFKPSDPSALTLPVKTTVRVQGGKSIYTYTLPEGNLDGYLLDPTWESQPGAAEGVDTRINGGSGVGYMLANYGAATTLQVGKANATWGPTRSLLLISLSAIPASSLCQSAQLTLTNVADTAQTAEVTIKLYVILSGNSGWVEGTGNGAQALAGEPCWNAKAADGAGGVTTAWAGSVGCGTAGTDYNATELGTATIGDDVAGTAYVISLTPASIQAWLGSDATNFGLLLKATIENTNGVFAGLTSSDGLTASQRPKATVVTVEQARRRNRLWWFGLIGGLHVT